MTEKTLFIDVGTHQAQEFAALFDHTAVGYLRHYLRHRRRSRRAGRVALPWSGFRQFLAQIKRLRAVRRNIVYVMVEPNARLFAGRRYRLADMAFNIALSSDPKTASVLPLFLAEGNPEGQGSSLFETKPNVRLGEFDLVLNVDALHFARSLAEIAAERAEAATGPVVLRLNNEGAEVEVIHAFHTVFGDRLKVVMGSLNDVAKVKGDAALGALHRFLADRGIPFLPFHSDFQTWPAAVEQVLKVQRPGPG
jgi:hypothetical protein